MVGSPAPSPGRGRRPPADRAPRRRGRRGRASGPAATLSALSEVRHGPRVKPDADIRRALEILEKDNVLISIPSASFPYSEGEDIGIGTPHSRAADALLRDLRRNGYTGVLLGPEGRISPGNPSPYDSTWFSRSELLLSLCSLEEAGWLDGRSRERATTGPSSSTDPEGAWNRIAWVLDRIHRRRHVIPQLETFREDHGSWLKSDALHAVLTEVHGHPDPRTWPRDYRAVFDERTDEPAGERWRILQRVFRERIDRYTLAQYLVAAQRQSFRDRTRALGLELWGDLQVGPSFADSWRFDPLFLRDYRLGAPPSRTNPAGQAWGYAVANPSLGAEIPKRLIRPRVARNRELYDGLRIDHPHGWVCPWVYRPDPRDPKAGVRAGARLFESPNLADHLELRSYALVRPEQLAPEHETPRHADDWVRDLEPEQVDTYDAWLRAIVEPFMDGRRARIATEVLSTQPHPLARVTEALGLGRFRVTQKADPDDPGDVYDAAHAAPEDWVMVGTHDTESIWSLADVWVGFERGIREARALADRLGAGPEERDRMASDTAALVHAKMADVFASPARNVIVFFADQFGCRVRYNEPGTVGPHNWTLRVPSHDPSTAALDLRRVLAGALRIRHAASVGEIRDLRRHLAQSSPAGAPV